MDPYKRNDDDEALLWQPASESTKTKHDDDDSDDEHETNITFRDTLRDFINSKWSSRIALFLSAILLLLTLRNRHATSSTLSTTDTSSIDWSKYAYIQYATEKQYLCNSIMIFESLSKLHTKAAKVMLYPADWDVGPEIGTFQSKLLLRAEADYGVELVPVYRRHLVDVSSTWRDSFVKLLAFNMTQYERVLSLDSDSTVMKSMDELFLLPPAPVAMPRAYWGASHSLSSALMLVTPSSVEFRRILDAIKHRSYEDFDMEIVNTLYGEDALVIPHRRYILLTGDFRRKTHSRYLGSAEAVWDPRKELDEAKFVHFSDWPYPKPWIMPDDDQKNEVEPKCTPGPEDDCTSANIWFGLYDDFRKRRLDVCGRALKMGTKQGFYS
ncbi:hypothetical protein MBLNU457_5694t2 [Dothideomycetes sp. NU457]